MGRSFLATNHDRDTNASINLKNEAIRLLTARIARLALLIRVRWNSLLRNPSLLNEVKVGIVQVVVSNYFIYYTPSCFYRIYIVWIR